MMKLYPFTGERLIPQDYTITATSRKTNLWACILSVLIILLAIGSLLYRQPPLQAQEELKDDSEIVKTRLKLAGRS